MIGMLPSLILSVASAVLSVRACGAWVRGRRRVRAGDPGRSALLVVAVPRAEEPDRSLARSLAASSHKGALALRVGSPAGDESGQRLVEEALRVAPAMDARVVHSTPSARAVPLPALAFEAARDHVSDVVALVDLSARPAARDLARLLACPVDGGERWVAAVPVRGTGGTSIGAAWSCVAGDLAPLTFAACGPAGLPALLSAGTRAAWNATNDDSLAPHRPTLAHSAALRAGGNALLVPVPSAMQPGREGTFVAGSMRVLWRARPLGLAWVLAALLALPAALAVAASGPSNPGLALLAVLLAWAFRAAVAVTWGRSTRGDGAAFVSVLFAPVRDVVSLVAIAAFALPSGVRVGGAGFRVGRGGVLVPLAEARGLDGQGF